MKFQVFVGYGTISTSTWQWVKFETEHYWDAVKFWAEYENRHGVEQDGFVYIHEDDDDDFIMNVTDKNGFCAFEYYKEISCTNR